MPLHLVAWRLRLSLADIGLRILPIIFLGKGGRRDSEEWLQYLLVTGKARSRKGLRLRYDPEYLNGFSVSFLLSQEILEKYTKSRYSPVRCLPCLTRVADSNVAKGPDVRASWRGVQSCSGRCEEEYKTISRSIDKYKYDGSTV
ncbi:hypothetical protein BPAE_0120g00240 [Botrytis paeoniae]|uniref:Uncharacterized protein n=1 Tax=Botrytis paeoniae TaxID=278948 RepID=A0A4Z1FHC7_9HELO|nr:hypothetical protein BPAE_0120g00240 [Botrytis paeoniae]